MAQQFIDFGSFPNDPTADPIRAAFQKIQDNFTDIYNTTSSAGVITLQTGAGLAQVGGTSGNILIISNIPSITIQTASSLLVGVGAATTNEAVISSSTQKFKLDLAPTITTTNANFSGLTKTSNLQIANYITSALVPNANVTYDLGTSSLRWKDLYLSGSTLYLGAQTIGANASSVNMSSLAVSSNITVGNVSATGTTTAGNATVSGGISTGTLTVSKTIGSHVRPSISEVYDLGNSVNRWKSLTITNTGITIGTQSITANASGIILSGVTYASNIIAPNANLGNATTSNYFIGDASYLSNIPSGNISGQVSNTLVAGTVYSGLQPNIVSLGTLTSLVVSGNVDSLSNLNAANLRSDYYVGDFVPYGNETQDLGSSTHRWRDLWLSGNTLRIGGTTISANSNTTTISGSVVTTSLEAGTVSATYLGGSLTSSSQPNITSVGILTGLSVSGNLLTGEMSVTGNVTATNIEVTTSISVPVITANVITPAGGTLSAPGNTTQLLFNDGGSTAAVPGMTFDKNSSLLSIQGNVAGGNLTSSGGLSVAGDASIGNVSTTGINASGNVNSGNVISLGIIAATGNLVGGNVVTNGFLSVTGNASIGSITTTTIDGTVVTVSGNVSGANLVASGVLSVQGSATVGNLSTSGNVIAGLLQATGNVSGGNLATGGSLSVTGAASVGTLTSGNINAGNVVGSTFTAALFSGNGASITFVNGANISGIVPSANNSTTVTGSSQPAITSVGTLTGLTVSGAFSGTNISASGYILASVATGLAATGTNQAGALQLTQQVNVIGTVTVGTSDGVKLPTATVGMQIVIINISTSACKVYPQSGGAIDSLATNAFFSLGAGARLMIIASGLSQWYTMVGVYG